MDFWGLRLENICEPLLYTSMKILAKQMYGSLHFYYDNSSCSCMQSDNLNRKIDINLPRASMKKVKS